MAARIILQLSVEMSADCEDEMQANMYAAAFTRFIQNLDEDMKPHPVYIHIDTVARYVLTDEGTK